MIFRGTKRQVQEDLVDGKLTMSRLEEIQTQDAEYLPRMFGVLIAGGLLAIPYNGGCCPSSDTPHFFLNSYEGD